MVILIFTIFCTWITLTVANSVIKLNHHTWAVLTFWWCNNLWRWIVVVVNDEHNAVDDKHLIKVLGKKKQYTAHEFLKEFPNKKWSLGGLNYLLEKMDKFSRVERLACSGRPWSTRIAEKIESVSAQSRRSPTQPLFCQTYSTWSTHFSLVCT